MRFWDLKSLFLGLLVCLWGLGLFVGIRSFEAYGRKEGQQGRFSLRWPNDSQITLSHRERASIVMFIHPECPCSKASLEELDRILAKAPKRKPEVYAVFVVPKGWTDERAKMALWLRANRMSGVTPLLDRDGQEAKRFGAGTSGQVYAYSPQGNLVFSGGITPSRGHSGDNPGRDAIVKYLQTGIEARTEWKIFGCSLFNQNDHADCDLRAPASKKRKKH